MAGGSWSLSNDVCSLGSRVTLSSCWECQVEPSALAAAPSLDTILRCLTAGLEFEHANKTKFRSLSPIKGQPAFYDTKDCQRTVQLQRQYRAGESPQLGVRSVVLVWLCSGSVVVSPCVFVSLRSVCYQMRQYVKTFSKL